MYGTDEGVLESDFVQHIAQADQRLTELVAADDTARLYLDGQTFAAVLDPDPLRAAEAEYYLCDALIEYSNRPGNDGSWPAAGLFDRQGTPMDTKTAAQLADDAAEAIRSLNHATLSTRPGWEYPSDAYSVVGGLARQAAGLPQALDQIGALLETLARHGLKDGRLTSDRGTVDADLIEAYGALADSTDAARTLYEALTRAHAALSPLGYQD
jgi:hypothetical protein